MKAKVGNQKTAQYIMGNGRCQDCTFYSESLLFCISMNCDVNGLFDQTETLEDIFKL